ncbi:MAG TPA: VOC family protein [Rhodanobacteraceae bacterium]|nr:VOC family protein [Rhodanobacteraceae bacterium]
MSHGAQALLRIGRNTADLARAIAFHRDALGFDLIDADAPPPPWTQLPGLDAAPSRCARLALGAQEIELTEFRDAAPYPRDSSSCDSWFQHFAIVTIDIETSSARVLALGATPITRDGPQRLPPSTGSVTAFKFRDPDGHPTELLALPPDVGDRCWHRSGADGPNLGIDHSAISVGDVGRSVLFYRLLGLDVAARGVNRGPEQQRLDDLPDVTVDVIAMQARAHTPHLELLGYRHPRGRPRQPALPTAVAADRLEWSARGIEVLVDAVIDAGFADPVLANSVVDGQTLALLRAPDGHLLLLAAADA